MRVQRAVAIGVSAGGLEVIQKIVRALPRDLPAAVFVVVHVPRTAPSMVPEILGRSTRLAVVAARDGQPVEATHVYVAPPDHHMLLQGGALRLSRGPIENHHRPAIDPLFRSVAASCGAGAVGVVVSGNLDDGTAGLLAIKRAGGTTVVQSPEDAMYPGMPRSAVQHVSVDHVVNGSEIGRVLSQLVLEPPKAEPVRAAEGAMGEVRIAELDVKATHEAQNEAVPSSFVCPDCGGTLFEVKDGDLARYRCRVGHAYGHEGLLAQKTADVEGALWAAVRALEERADALGRAAARARLRASDPFADGLDRKAAFDAERADAVLSLIAKAGET